MLVALFLAALALSPAVLGSRLLAIPAPKSKPPHVEVLSQGEVEVLSQQGLTSPSKPPAPKKAKKDGDGSSKDRALELSESQE